MSIFSLLVLPGRVLHVLIGIIGDSTTDQEDGVQADPEAGGGRAGGGGRGGLLLGAGSRIAGLGD